MRLPDTPMSPAEFELAIQEATRGRLASDIGADDRLREALVDIATNGPSPARVAEARAAFGALAATFR